MNEIIYNYPDNFSWRQNTIYDLKDFCAETKNIDYFENFKKLRNLAIKFKFILIFIQVLSGNTNADQIQTNYILPAFHARYVRIHPKSWIGRICMRLELYGCESTGKDEGMHISIIISIKEFRIRSLLKKYF